MCFGLNDIGKFPAKRPCGPVNLYNDLVSSVSRRTGRRIVAEFCRWRKTGKEDGETERRRDGETEGRRMALSLCPAVSLSLCLSVSLSLCLSTVFSTAAARVVSRVPIVDCENSTRLDHSKARSGLGHRTDVDQGEYPVTAQRQQVARAVRISL